MKIIKRILLGLVGIIVALVLFVVGSIVVEGALGSGRIDALTNTKIPNAAGPEVRAFVARPSTPGPHPAVIMIHEWWGLKEDIVGKAKALAEEGYVVVAPDLMRGGSTSSIPRAIYQISSNPATQIDSDLDAVFQWLAAQSDVQPDKIAVLGFCFGGGTSLRYSANSGKPAATVLFYGMPIADKDRLKKLSGPVLGIFGGADGSIPVANVNAMQAALTDAGVKNEVKIYEGQPHAFVTSIENIRKGGPQQEAWNQMLAFLKASLQGKASHMPSEQLVATNAQNDEVTWSYVLQVAIGHIGAHQH